uniref:Uncharacterized protein n=1 Tax=Glossina morsitans morsitans TaxID=37546 RepID=A0ABK9NFY3_GLOMM
MIIILEEVYFLIKEYYTFNAFNASSHIAFSFSFFKFIR